MNPKIFSAILCVASAVLIMVLSGCVASSSYYTGRTLEPGQEVARVGADYILNTASDGNRVQVGATKDFPISFVPSIGLAFGLPLRLETSLRWYPVKFLEGSLRWQVNPRSFDPFDASLNFSYAGLIGEYSYARYGVTVSKNMNAVEPYINFSLYHLMGRINSDLNITYKGSTIIDFANGITEGMNTSRSVAFGVAVPIVKTKLFPEINYFYNKYSFPQGLWSFGIGLQINGW